MEKDECQRCKALESEIQRLRSIIVRARTASYIVYSRGARLKQPNTPRGSWSLGKGLTEAAQEIIKALDAM